MNFKDYQSIKSINASLLKQSGSIYSAWLAINTKFEANKAMNFGSAVHGYILEPHLFNDQFAVSESFDKRTKEGKAGAAAFESVNQGKIIIDRSDMDKIIRIKKNIDRSQMATTILQYDKEISYSWESDGNKYKARLDIVSESNGLIADLKTTRTTSTKDFLSDAISMNYDLQFLHYAKAVMDTTGITPDIYAIAIETESCEIALYNLNKIVYSDYTANKYKVALSNLLTAMKLTECPSKYPDAITHLELPNWVK